MTASHTGMHSPTPGHHDLGGSPLGSVDRSEHPRTLYEMRVDAMVMLLTNSHSIRDVIFFPLLRHEKAPGAASEDAERTN